MAQDLPVLECSPPARCAGRGIGILLIAITAVAIFGPSLDVGPIFYRHEVPEASDYRERLLEPVLLPGMAPL